MKQPRNAPLLILALLCLVACGAKAEAPIDRAGESSSFVGLQEGGGPASGASPVESHASESVQSRPELESCEPRPEPAAVDSGDAREVYRTLYPSYSREVKQIAYDATNATGEMRGFGDRMRLQIRRQGEWESYPVIPLPENAAVMRPAISVGFIDPYTTSRSSAILDTWLSIGSAFEASLFEEGILQPIDCPLYEFPLEQGVYRLIDEFGQLSNSFEITDEPSEAQARLMERLKGVPGLEQVEFSPHDFTIPFAYQGLISDFETSGIKLYGFLLPEKEEARAVYGGVKEDGYVITSVYKKNGEFTYGMETRYNWEDPPHFWSDFDRILYLYCGNNEELLNQIKVHMTEVYPN